MLSLDVRYAIRILGRTPVFTIAAVLSLALGIGANTAIFTVVNAVLLRPLPYAEPDRLVGIAQRHVEGGLEVATLPDFTDWREHASTLASIGGAWGVVYNLTGIDEPERLSGAAVTGDFFETFRLEPVIGRRFTTAADENPAVVVLSNSLWRRRFGSAPEVIGRMVELNGRRHEVIGVMPAGFFWPDTTELWVPLVPEQGMNRGYHLLQVTGRLQPARLLRRHKPSSKPCRAARALSDTNKDWGRVHRCCNRRWVHRRVRSGFSRAPRRACC